MRRIEVVPPEIPEFTVVEVPYVEVEELEPVAKPVLRKRRKETMKVRNIRMLDRQWEKVKRYGDTWLRRLIDINGKRPPVDPKIRPDRAKLRGLDRTSKKFSGLDR